MVSLNDIKAIYESPDLIEGRVNYAFDISAGIKVIKLLDGKIKYGKNEVYIPDESYLMTFKEADKTVKCRHNFNLKEKNLFPSLVHEGIEGKAEELLAKISRKFEPASRNEIENWMASSGLEEITNLSSIYKKRKARGSIDMDGLAILQGIKPINPVIKNYELNGICYFNDLIANIPLPAEISAREAEFTFVSDQCAKITDGNKGVGRYKEGILTLHNASFFVKALDDTIREESTNYRLGVNFLEKEDGDSTLSYLKVGAAIGFGVGCLLSLSTCHFAHIANAEAGITIKHILLYNIGIPTIAGALIGFMIKHTKDYASGWGDLIKIYDISGSSLMKAAFYGRVKDMRFEGLEGILV